jgi:hypothetical protein
LLLSLKLCQGYATSIAVEDQDVHQTGLLTTIPRVPVHCLFARLCVRIMDVHVPGILASSRVQ